LAVDVYCLYIGCQSRIAVGPKIELAV
jgi:hypothetical protein